MEIESIIKQTLGDFEKQNNLLVIKGDFPSKEIIIDKVKEINNKAQGNKAFIESFSNSEIRIKIIKNWDHREIGKKNIFDFDSLIGAGLPFWLEDGWILKQKITTFINKVQQKYGISMVSTPELGKKELYEISGHMQHYKENIFPTMQLDKEGEYVLRPMTCPHHIILYQKEKRHEKHLPIAFGENAKLYRYEYSGGLFGLERTRCMELIDTHIFCSEEQLIATIKNAWNIINEIKKTFEIKNHSIILGLRDSEKEKFYNDDQLWEKSESILKNFLKTENIEYTEGLGDGAFYGPKIDFQIKTAMNKVITISTIQLDFLLPNKFKLEYMVGEKGEVKTPIMIHLGIIGTLERFIAYLLERDNGHLPFWLSPKQIAIIPINSDHNEQAKKLNRYYQSLGIRSYIEDKSISVGKKILKVKENRVYGYIVIGDKEDEWISELENKKSNGILEELEKITKVNNNNSEHILEPEWIK